MAEFSENVREKIPFFRNFLFKVRVFAKFSQIPKSSQSMKETGAKSQRYQPYGKRNYTIFRHNLVELVSKTIKSMDDHELESMFHYHNNIKQVLVSHRSVFDSELSSPNSAAEVEPVSDHSLDRDAASSHFLSDELNHRIEDDIQNQPVAEIDPRYIRDNIHDVDSENSDTDGEEDMADAPEPVKEKNIIPESQIHGKKHFLVPFNQTSLPSTYPRRVCYGMPTKSKVLPSDLCGQMVSMKIGDGKIPLFEYLYSEGFIRNKHLIMAIHSDVYRFAVLEFVYFSNMGDIRMVIRPLHTFTRDRGGVLIKNSGRVAEDWRSLYTSFNAFIIGMNENGEKLCHGKCGGGASKRIALARHTVEMAKFIANPSLLESLVESFLAKKTHFVPLWNFWDYTVSAGNNLTRVMKPGINGNAFREMMCCDAQTEKLDYVIVKNENVVVYSFLSCSFFSLPVTKSSAVACNCVSSYSVKTVPRTSLGPTFLPRRFSANMSAILCLNGVVISAAKLFAIWRTGMGFGLVLYLCQNSVINAWAKSILWFAAAAAFSRFDMTSMRV